jgi:hypothetical protein
MPKTKFGPGTMTFTVAAGPPVEFAQEVKGGGITHEYSEAGEATTYLDASSESAGATRGDKLAVTCDFDLGAAGLYAFLDTNDLLDAAVVYTPNTASGASWTGTVQLRMPDGATAENFGAKISGGLELPFIGKAVFEPGA